MTFRALRKRREAAEHLQIVAMANAKPSDIKKQIKQWLEPPKGG